MEQPARRGLKAMNRSIRCIRSQGWNDQCVISHRIVSIYRVLTMRGTGHERPTCVVTLHAR